MSFLQKSALHKHLSASRHLPHHNEQTQLDGSRVVLRDGNFITVPATTVDQARIDKPTIKPA